MEHLLLGAIPREATLLAHLQRSHPGVKDVHLSVGGVCRYHLWVQFEKKREGEAKNVILCAFGAHYDIKQVVVVDTDVDVHDPAEIEWAIATRFQADRDLVVIEGAQGSPLDPSTTVGQPDGRAAASARREREDGSRRDAPRGLSGARVHARAHSRPGHGRSRRARRRRQRRVRRLPEPRSWLSGTRQRIVVGISGASGAVIGVRLLAALRRLGTHETHLIVSASGAVTAAQELGLDARRPRCARRRRPQRARHRRGGGERFVFDRRAW